MMKIIVEATPILPKPSGVGLYVINLLGSLERLQSEDNFELGISYQPSLKNWLRGNLTVPEVLHHYENTAILPLPVRLLNLLARIPGKPFISNLEDWFGRPDIYHGTNYAVFPCRHSLRVMTIYDLTFIRFPDYVTAVVRTYNKRVKQCLEWTDLVVTISESSKQDIVNYLGIAPERVWVTPLASRYAVDSYAPKPASLSHPQSRKGLIQGAKGFEEKPYILFVSTLEPRKNLVGLIQAFNRLKSHYKVPHQLVLVGQKGWKVEPILRAMDESPWRDQIHHLDYLSDDEVAYCYSHADVFAYPSLYEGFGLPVLEAMTLGCPVVTSNTSSLPEVAGDAALLVTPTDVEELVAALEQVISDRTLRESLIERGYRQAAQFSWARTAKSTLAAYRSIL